MMSHLPLLNPPVSEPSKLVRILLDGLHQLGLTFIALGHSIADTIALCAVAFFICLSGATGILLAPALSTLIRNAWRSML